LREDLGPRDVTTAILVDKNAPGKAGVIAKEPLVLAGVDAFTRVFYALGNDSTITWSVKEGEMVEPKTVLAHLNAPA